MNLNSIIYLLIFGLWIPVSAQYLRAPLDSNSIYIGNDSLLLGIEADEELDDSGPMVNPITYPPVACGCEYLGQNEQKACTIAYIQEIINTDFAMLPGLNGIGLSLRIFVNFLVDENAQISSIQVVRGLESDIFDTLPDLAIELEKEVIRTIKSFEFVLPAYQNCRPVKQSMTVPIKISH